MAQRTLVLLICCAAASAGGCIRFDDFKLEGAGGQVDAGDAADAGDPGAPPATPGQRARPALLLAPPGPEGPFVEPGLDERPTWLYAVEAGQAATPEALAAAAARLAALPAVPIGYPVIDQAGILAQEGDQARPGFVLLAGKFARRAWAEALRQVIADAGGEARVVTTVYHFDRNRPARNDLPGPRAGRVFAGMAGATIPLLTEPGEEATATAGTVVDGQWLTVREERWIGNRRWYRVETGSPADPGQAGGAWLEARRVLTDANVFPATTGRRAVLGVSLGCHKARCRWDYWLVGPGYAYRRLIKSGGERMPHAFTPDGAWLVYTDFEPALELLAAEEPGAVARKLGPGISPSFNSDGSYLYFRGPGIKEHRDAVYRLPSTAFSAAEPPAPKQIFDFGGAPHYPRVMAAIPPQVDFLDSDDELFTLFFRLVDKKGKKQIQRWGVRFTPQGKLLEKAGALIAE